MSDEELTINILVRLIGKARAYDAPLLGKTVAVPLREITKELEALTTTSKGEQPNSGAKQ